jgi:hypothetical protein
MKGDGRSLPLLSMALGGFGFSFAGAILAVGISQLFTAEGDYWIVFSAIGASVVSLWGWFYWADTLANHDKDVFGDDLKRQRFQ